MTSTAPYRPRHAAQSGRSPVDAPTVTLPAPRHLVVLQAAHTLTFAPPAGLPVGHEPIRPRSVAPVVLSAVAAFVVVSSGVATIGTLAREAATVAGHGDAAARSTSEQVTDQRDGGVLGRP